METSSLRTRIRQFRQIRGQDELAVRGPRGPRFRRRVAVRFYGALARARKAQSLFSIQLKRALSPCSLLIAAWPRLFVLLTTLPVLTGCHEHAPVRSRRVDAVSSHFAPNVRLGQHADSVFAAFPQIRLRRDLSDVAQRAPLGAPSSIDAYVVRAVSLQHSWLGALANETGATNATRRGAVRSIILWSVDSAAPARAESLITRLFGASPREACAGWEGLAEDRISYWVAGDRGNVVLTQPARGTPRDRWVSQLILNSGPFDGDRVEIGFRDAPCPSR